MMCVDDRVNRYLEISDVVNYFLLIRLPGA